MAKLEGGIYYPGVTVPGFGMPQPPGAGDPGDNPYDLYPPPASGPPGNPITPIIPPRVQPVDPWDGVPLPPSVIPRPVPGNPRPAPVQPDPGPILSGSAISGLAGLAIVVGPLVARFVWPAIRAAGRLIGTRSVPWSSIPAWVQRVLIGAGIIAGTDFVLDVADVGPEQPGGGLTPIIPGPPETFPTVGTYPAAVTGDQVVGGWMANGTPFVKLASGKLGAMKRDGTWKFWRPKKPVVIYPGGVSNLRDLLKADETVDRQMQKLRKAIKRRAPRTPSPKCGTCGYVRCRCKH